MGKVRVKCWPGLRFTRYDLIALLLAILIPVTAIILIMVSVLPALGAPALPSFDEPIKGFEPRGTELSDRIITLENLRNEPSISWYLPTSNQQGSVLIDSSGHQPKHSTTVKRRRRSLVTGSLEPPLCTNAPFDYMVFVFKTPADSENNLFDANRLRSICAMENEIVRQRLDFESACLMDYDGSKLICCSSWSLGNYVALLNNRKSCQDITDGDVASVKNLLRNCSSYFLKQILRGNCSSYYADPSGNVTIDPTCASIPLQCVKYNYVYNIFQYLVDNQFMSASDDGFLKYSAVLTAVNYDIQFFKDVYNAELKDGLPETKDIELAGVEFGHLKFNLFNDKLIAEVAFPALAMIVVFAIMWFFLGSFILTFCGLFCIIYAIGLSYFLYTIVFKIEFFPFLNLTTFIFLVGIGADDAFVYYDIWRQTKAANPNANVMQLTLKTLRYAALSMLVTSLTTASAFFAGVSSTITAIKCFGIFAGTSILTNYLLMITYFPAAVVLHERWVLKYTGGQGSDGVMPSEMAMKKGTSYPAPDSQDMSDSREAEGIVTSSETQESKPFCVLQIIDFPCLLLVSAKRSLQRASAKVFEHWLPLAVIKLHWLWIALFVCLTAGFLVVCFFKPGLQTPSSTEFQVFGSSHPLEQYSLHYKSSFRFEQKNGGLTINLVWGIKPEDNGNYLNADDKGTLQFDETFGELFSPKGQQFLRSLCQSAEQQPFFARFNTPDGKCPIDTFIEGCVAGPNPCCGNYAKSDFPFPSNITEMCIKKFAQFQQTGIFFDTSSGKIRGFMLVILSKQSFTTAFDAMDNFWKEVNSWAKTEMAKAPPGLRNGWASSWGIDHYALQVGLSEGTYSSMGISVAVSFSIMLLTTLNIFISIYAIITIIGIIAITVGSLVLAGWQLNILESIVMSVAVGLSIDFTMHYGVAYRLAPDKSDRQNRVRYSLVHIGSAITMAAVTTFLTGAMMMPATVLAYYQLGQFLMLVMVFSWLYATFAFLSICAVIGPKGKFGQLSVTNLFRKCGLCRVKPDNSESHQGKPELDDVAATPDAAAPEQADSITTPL